MAFLLLLVLLALAAPTHAANGFQETATKWREVHGKASQYRLILQNIYAQVESQVGPDKSKLNKAFARRLNALYPESNYFGGAYGSLAVNNYTWVHFDTAWNITNLRQQFGGLQKNYDFRNQTMEVVNGPNRVKFKLDLRQPEKSQFITAEIPAVSATAQEIRSQKGGWQASVQPLKDILNDTYAQQIALGDGTRMDELAERMVEDEGTRQFVLNTAAEIYSNAREKSRAQTGLPGLLGEALHNTQSGVRGLTTISVFRYLPWYFWPFLILLVAVNVLNTGTRRASRPRKAARLKKTGEFSLGRRAPSRKPAEPGTSPGPGLESLADEPFEDLDHDEWSLQLLSSLEWKRFETVCAEYLRLIGFAPKETRIGADGGVDIWVYRQGVEKAVGIVQCKAWTTYRVGVKPVRELYGVMAAEGVANGKFIISGEFSSEALAFAEGKRLELISGKRFVASIRKLSAEKQLQLLNIAIAGDYRTPTCPQCGVKMTLRQGRASDRQFWGCPKYPRCSGTLVYKPAEG
ncbi:hypothetical protein DESUT3_19210 [Desulfuromonas versatilis]|uniref:Restriction endonuclease n=1 Tax=Desulfuromonas versatilis TaxID=2802975 RepID=A0ABM8HUV5_9BACT|nr:restriction endonuclease [Desulfuromonas versatilis]BCR04852.1 hypothetical protein DESUT3_19210 [Desulfuromonas versatilis]